MPENIALIIAIALVVIALAGALAIHMYIFKRYQYKCVKCSTSYKPSTLWQSICGLNGGSQRKLKCPQCNKRQWAKVQKITI